MCRRNATGEISRVQGKGRKFLATDSGVSIIRSRIVTLDAPMRTAEAMWGKYAALAVTLIVTLGNSER